MPMSLVTREMHIKSTKTLNYPSNKKKKEKERSK
jgi:hypothetical protein